MKLKLSSQKCSEDDAVCKVKKLLVFLAVMPLHVGPAASYAQHELGLLPHPHHLLH